MNISYIECHPNGAVNVEITDKNPLMTLRKYSFHCADLHQRLYDSESFVQIWSNT